MAGVWTLLSWGPEGWLDDIASGVFVTVSLAVCTLPFGLFAGFLIALAKKAEEPSLRIAGNIYTTIFRGLPELLTLFLIYFGAQVGLQQLIHFFNPSATVEISSFVAGMIALGLVFSSYASEVFLSAFRAIPRGQYEGAMAVGLSSPKTMRLVILPQLIRIALPGLSNLWLILLKDTALVSAIGLSDIVRQAGVAARVTKHAFLFFGVACLIYLALAIISSIGIGFIERWVGKRDAVR
ncbi:ABC transporter permease subunit [Mesorhizobium sp. NBSH29]|uniref:ABC transporter permease n=1 Tax=Mesorhizobium sp. NBSH29 TaxID=2654249 RepID=UPI0018965E9D|nr:ABC transporter permease [Mesorhizobium sp. NBSH29]QPC87997.1 ABC transporter permease subunit [Mesorhizobium sp. NBSH29]